MWVKKSILVATAPAHVGWKASAESMLAEEKFARFCCNSTRGRTKEGVVTHDRSQANCIKGALIIHIGIFNPNSSTERERERVDSVDKIEGAKPCS